MAELESSQISLSCGVDDAPTLSRRDSRYVQRTLTTLTTTIRDFWKLTAGKREPDHQQSASTACSSSPPLQCTGLEAHLFKSIIAFTRASISGPPFALAPLNTRAFPPQPISCKSSIVQHRLWRHTLDLGKYPPAFYPDAPPRPVLPSSPIPEDRCWKRPPDKRPALRPFSQALLFFLQQVSLIVILVCVVASCLSATTSLCVATW